MLCSVIASGGGTGWAFGSLPFVPKYVCCFFCWISPLQLLGRQVSSCVVGERITRIQRDFVRPKGLIIWGQLAGPWIPCLRFVESRRILDPSMKFVATFSSEVTSLLPSQ